MGRLLLFYGVLRSLKYKITEIQFDFTEDDPDVDAIDIETQDEIYDNVMNTVWNVEDEETLVDKISDSIGWCIKSISYVPI